jgi:hypothetical protein
MTTQAFTTGRDNRPEDKSNSKTLVIPASLTALSASFFEGRDSVEVLRFDTGSGIHRLAKGTFCSCISLKSIFIPSSVEFLEMDCFFDSSSRPPCGWLAVRGDGRGLSSGKCDI